MIIYISVLSFATGVVAVLAVFECENSSAWWWRIGVRVGYLFGLTALILGILQVLASPVEFSQAGFFTVMNNLSRIIIYSVTGCMIGYALYGAYIIASIALEDQKNV